MQKYRIGIIGCGYIATRAKDNHLKAYKELGFDDIYFCDTNAKALERVKSDNRKYFGSATLMSENLDIVSICTPPETHREIVEKVAPYVKGIFLEKPIAMTLEDADAIINVCRRNDVKLQINHQRLFMSPKFRFSRGVLNTGTHAFSLIEHLFKPEINVDIEYIDTDKHIFELDCTHNKEPMIKKGIENLIYCIENNSEPVSSGEKARNALWRCLKMLEKSSYPAN
jgi:hypothetical protein